jgi:3-isopropylmalate dehydrogenase
MGPMSTYDYAGAGTNPSAFFRKQLDLFANIRPARTYPGLKAPLGDFDLVVVRENTEGFYADRNMHEGSAEMLVTPDVCVSLRRITRDACMRIAGTAFRLAQRRRRKVTAVHKANVLRLGDGLFLECCRTVAKDYPQVELEEVIVDAMTAHLVRAPGRFDVIVTTNMYGDILSDLTAELSGSIGLGGSVNAGEVHAMAQAAHGSAPDIAGQDRANPVSLVLSAAMLLAWHAERSGANNCAEAAAAIEHSVVGAISAGECTRDLGGSLGTAAMGKALAARVESYSA